ncbi:MAG: hypothetical protein CMM93_01795 [Rickettsiales bacterium]|nr:hypothetical protein [Rickettsiales bacterium]|tara:strand:- start:146 stop:535 length:390 start_codon:yes stop_codon:yes gene_type:complete
MRRYPYDKEIACMVGGTVMVLFIGIGLLEAEHWSFAVTGSMGSALGAVLAMQFICWRIGYYQPWLAVILVFTAITAPTCWLINRYVETPSLIFSQAVGACMIGMAMSFTIGLLTMREMRRRKGKSFDLR